jgi:hypothetical protein
MSRRVLRIGLGLALLLAPAVQAYADDPTSILLQERGEAPRYPGPLPPFTEGGVCYQGMHTQPFNNLNGYRCVRDRPSG